MLSFVLFSSRLNLASISSMAKKWRFLHKLKKLFLCQHQSQPDRKILSGASAAQCTVHEADLEEQMKHATDAATAAAEAAAVAAQAAAVVARLAAQQIHGREVYDWAATKIQTRFRGYIARKALRALKAVVRLQAIARGRALRRRVHSQLKRSPSFTKLTRVGRILDLGLDKEKGSRPRDVVIDTNTELKRSIKYSVKERQLRCTEVLEETPSRRYDKMQGYLGRQSWAGERLQRSAAPDNSLPNLNTNARADGESSESTRRSSCSQTRERWSEEESFSPSYMAATASARAKMRSTSTPRRRIGYPDQHLSDRHRDLNE